MNIAKLKGCKRCGGDLFQERDAEGVYITYLQCGAVYIKRAKEERKDRKEVPVR